MRIAITFFSHLAPYLNATTTAITPGVIRQRTEILNLLDSKTSPKLSDGLSRYEGLHSSCNHQSSPSAHYVQQIL